MIAAISAVRYDGISLVKASSLISPVEASSSRSSSSRAIRNDDGTMPLA